MTRPWFIWMARALTRDITRSKHAGILAAFREQFVKPGDFPVEDSLAYGQAFEMRNVADYEQLGRADPDQAQAVIKDSERFVDRCVSFLKGQRYL